MNVAPAFHPSAPILTPIYQNYISKRLLSERRDLLLVPSLVNRLESVRTNITVKRAMVGEAGQRTLSGYPKW